MKIFAAIKIALNLIASLQMCLFLTHNSINLNFLSDGVFLIYPIEPFLWKVPFAGNEVYVLHLKFIKCTNKMLSIILSGRWEDRYRCRIRNK